MFNKKSTRIILGLIFLFFLIISFVPNLYISNSSDGIINARTTTLRSPIEGVVHYCRPTQCGSSFAANDLIGKVINERINQAHLFELTTEKKTLASRVAALTTRLNEFDALRRRLENNINLYQQHSARQLEEQLKQTADKLAQEQAEYDRAKKEFDANRKLIDRQAVKKREFETSEAALIKSTSRIKELTNHRAELQNSLNAVKAGIFLGDGHNDVPYSSQRRDQLVIETSLAKTTLAEAQDRIAGIAQQLAGEQQRLDKMGCYPFQSPFHSLVWRLSATEGSSVVIDSELLVLLDCSSIFLDFVVSESQFSDIKAGAEIQYRLIGESAYHSARVFALRGSGSDLADHNIAATLTKDPKREFHIWAKVKSDELDSKPENYYQVGRRAEVRIPRHWKLWQELIRFVNVF